MGNKMFLPVDKLQPMIQFRIYKELASLMRCIKETFRSVVSML